MIVSSRRLRNAAAVALAASLVLGAAACSKKNSGGTSSGGASAGPVTLVLQTFGAPGFDQAIKDFQAANPTITVNHQAMGELKDFTPKLNQYLAAGSGAGDVVMMEEGIIGDLVAQADKFTDLYSLGANDIKSDYLPYKIGGASTADGKKLIGLGTDVGPMAMCYRTDLFAKAGLPTDRDQVSAMMSTWDAYETMGKQFAAKVKDSKWLDSATSVVQPMVMQLGDQWFNDKSNKFIGDTNPNFKQAWDYGLKLASEGLTGKFARWTDDWTAGFKKAAWATQPCPGWMTGVISGDAGDAGKGKWDIATIPGKGGNWGGSWLGIPAQGKHQKEAFELVKFLTGKQGQLDSFKEKGNFPSNIQAENDPTLASSTNAYFNNAPVGKIFGTAAQGLKPIYLGSHHQTYWETDYEPQMQAAEQGKSSSADAFAKATADAKKVANG
jgi:cellobiose transport system substrate-binding protein